MTFNQILLIYRTLVYHFLPLCSTLLNLVKKSTMITFYRTISISNRRTRSSSLCNTGISFKPIGACAVAIKSFFWSTYVFRVSVGMSLFFILDFNMTKIFIAILIINNLVHIFLHHVISVYPFILLVPSTNPIKLYLTYDKSH